MFHGEDEVGKLWALLDVVMDLNIPFVSHQAHTLTSLISVFPTYRS